MAVTVIKNYTRRVVAPKSKKGLVIGITLLAATGIGLYIWYLHNKKKKELDAKNGTTSTTTLADAVVGAVNSVTKPSTSTSTPVTTSISSSTNPIVVESAKPADVLGFQKWANKNKGTSLVEDGIFGTKTKAVWNSFGQEYTKLISMTQKDFASFMSAGGDPIGKTVYSKYAGADVFDGNTADNIYNKISATAKAQVLGKVAKITKTATGYWVTFSGGAGKFYKMYSANLNILA